MIFNAIYMHRSKDSHDEIRLTCVRHIHNLILYDMTKPLKTEYLKYLGWACFDYAHSVREEAVKAIKKLVQVRLCFEYANLCASITYMMA
ncbi:hypothetical protein EON65_28975 [archaeon]|nr:MAG: hypothetical protein EON65_28975 [archaeon]